MNSGTANNKLIVKKFVLGPLATNCYLVYTSDTRKGMLIDPAWHDELIEKYIADNKLDMLYILNTHGHADHIMGNASFGLPVLIHELDEEYLRNSVMNLAVNFDEKFKPTKAEKVFKGDETLFLGDLELAIIHTPGHTPGGISVLYDNILFSGDTLFYEGIGRTDIGGSQEVILKSIKEKLMVLPDPTIVYPGHGPETTIGHERKNNPFLI